MKTILISAALGGNANTHKVKYLEMLEECLLKNDTSLLLVNYSPEPLSTHLRYIDVPKYILDNSISSECKQNQLLTKSGQIAAAIDSEYYQRDLLTSSILLQKYAAYMEQIIKEEVPSLVIMWCQFIPRHIILKGICDDKGVPCMYTHLGLLPGTIEFETGGQVAESLVATNATEFEKLHINEDDLLKTQNYIESVKLEEKTRKAQIAQRSLSEIEALCRRENRKIVFFAGNNDYYSGFWPSWIPNSKIHSPLFLNTLDALSYLEELAVKHNWQIIFKPHPNIEKRHQKFELITGERVYFATGANIFECIKVSDLVSTISSTVSYLTVMCEKPLLMLGNNQLTQKGIAYEGETRDEIESNAVIAINEKVNNEMLLNGKNHIARLLKYYVFSFDDETKGLVGRDIETCADFLVSHV